MRLLAVVFWSNKCAFTRMRQYVIISILSHFTLTSFTSYYVIAGRGVLVMYMHVSTARWPSCKLGVLPPFLHHNNQPQTTNAGFIHCLVLLASSSYSLHQSKVANLATFGSDFERDGIHLLHVCAPDFKIVQSFTKFYKILHCHPCTTACRSSE